MQNEPEILTPEELQVRLNNLMRKLDAIVSIENHPAVWGCCVADILVQTLLCFPDPENHIEALFQGIREELKKRFNAKEQECTVKK